MDKNYLNSKYEKFTIDINKNKLYFYEKEQIIIDFINFAYNILEKIQDLFRENEISSSLNKDFNKIIFIVFDGNKQNEFEYVIKVNNVDQITTYSSALDPDTDSFRPKDIFGDFGKLDISELNEKNIIDDFFERYKRFSIKKIEENYSSKFS